jgi:diacylglycerol kinase family enzyme
MGHTFAPGAGTTVLVNHHARGVRSSTARRLKEAAPAASVILTHTREEAEDAIRNALACGFRRIVAGGGDGTVSAIATEIRNQVNELRQTNPGQALPELGVLKLGTGNAVADVLGGCRNFADDLRRMAANVNPQTTDLDLIDCEGVQSPFVGFGYDAQILNDFITMKNRARPEIVKKIVGTAPGYLLAAFGMSLPKQIMRKRDAEVRVINAGRRVFRATPHGLFARDIAPGQVIYQGPIRMLSAGTVPYYGFKFRMFPYARTMPGLMQLRVATTGAPEAIANLPGIWRGTYDSSSVEDYLLEAVQVRFSEPMPFQVGGDAAGYRREITFGVAPEAFRVLDLQRAA